MALLNSAPDVVLAFHAQGSRGTAHAIRAAIDRGVPVRRWTPDGPDCPATDDVV